VLGLVDLAGAGAQARRRRGAAEVLPPGVAAPSRPGAGRGLVLAVELVVEGAPVRVLAHGHVGGRLAVRVGLAGVGDVDAVAAERDRERPAELAGS
jgi:hypothetical protein